MGGGNTVVISGDHLSTATAVKFGATSLFPTVDSSSQITVTAPVAPGPRDVLVQVITPGGPSNALTYAYA
ncbi:hypothetical protein SBI_07445 [Streptomyces bingchenggensis BCW-1]|uniref:IPT/TIG domain-containing protein n=1 Tax=Streptomyces bingchenggensis (strain BCW-1) TaxID=749414 RepID=D7C947_STRBB|nr:hypothetical protein SBI_07445 [Streptomyces bingchenggensis BCW-1]